MSDKVCIIGAGVSGLATVKALKEAGVAFDCFDIASDFELRKAVAGKLDRSMQVRS